MVAPISVHRYLEDLEEKPVPNRPRGVTWIEGGPLPQPAAAAAPASAAPSTPVAPPAPVASATPVVPQAGT